MKHGPTEIGRRQNKVHKVKKKRGHFYPINTTDKARIIMSMVTANFNNPKVKMLMKMNPMTPKNHNQY